MTLLETILKKEEGLRLTVYADEYGKATCGWGHLCTPDDDLEKGDAISQEEADAFFADDKQTAIDAVTAHIPWSAFMNDDTRRAVLDAMAFQMGINSLMAFHYTLGAIHAGNWQVAHDSMLKSKWATKDSPARAARMAEIVLTGIVPDYYNQ